MPAWSQNAWAPSVWVDNSWQDMSTSPQGPTITSVFITGEPMLNQTLTGNYVYSDLEGDLEGVSTFRWLRDSTPISGETTQTYTLVFDDIGKIIKFEVTPIALTGILVGTASQSAGVGPVTSNVSQSNQLHGYITVGVNMSISFPL